MVKYLFRWCHRQLYLNAILEPEDVAEAIIFLLSDKSKMLNGITMPVDGGFCAV